MQNNKSLNETMDRIRNKTVIKSSNVAADSIEIKVSDAADNERTSSIILTRDYIEMCGIRYKFAYNLTDEDYNLLRNDIIDYTLGYYLSEHTDNIMKNLYDLIYNAILEYHIICPFNEALFRLVKYTINTPSYYDDLTNFNESDRFISVYMEYFYAGDYGNRYNITFKVYGNKYILIESNNISDIVDVTDESIETFKLIVYGIYSLYEAETILNKSVHQCHDECIKLAKNINKLIGMIRKETDDETD